MSKTYGENFMARLMEDLSGNTRAVVLLQRLHWHQVARWNKPVPWITVIDKNLMKDCGMKRRAYYYALGYLKSKGLIERLPRRTGKKGMASPMRLTDRALGLINGTVKPDSDSPPAKPKVSAKVSAKGGAKGGAKTLPKKTIFGKISTPGLVQDLVSKTGVVGATFAPLYKYIIEGESFIEGESVGAASADAETLPKAGKLSGKVVEKEKNKNPKIEEHGAHDHMTVLEKPAPKPTGATLMATIAEIIANKSYKQPKPVATPVKPGDLAKLYRHAHECTYPHRFIKAFTAKEMGLFSHMLKQCGADRAGKVITTCVENWPSFAAHLSSEGGWKSPPTHPSVSFLATALNHAVAFIDGVTPAKGVTPVTVAPVKVTAPPGYTGIKKTTQSDDIADPNAG